MKNFRKLGLIGLPLIAFYTAITVVYAATGSVDASDNNGAEKATFMTNEAVYLAGNCMDAASQDVDLYIVDHQETWTDQAPLTDVRGASTTLTVNSLRRLCRQRNLGHSSSR